MTIHAKKVYKVVVIFHNGDDGFELANDFRLNKKGSGFGMIDWFVDNIHPRDFPCNVDDVVTVQLSNYTDTSIAISGFYDIPDSDEYFKG